ncbi:SigE family RNA polymerase sigma factor [Streptomyces sp. NPDC021020]|uniref:SigE family RNA polymerase sigma factor n=1 Tax=Streptomyces sp. NPDC021020 TaxID=3365109 RepID=UPI0037A30F38
MAAIGARTSAGSSPGAVLDFEEYVRTRQEALLRSARRLVPDPIDAQDLVQTALVRTFPRWDTIADKTLADAYMRRVMINTRTEWWRSRRLDEVPTGELPESVVDDGAEQRADREMLLDAIAGLAPKQRQVVMLRHYGQLTTEETARTLGLSIGTVKSTLHRALARLRDHLEDSGYGYRPRPAAAAATGTGSEAEELTEAMCVA